MQKNRIIPAVITADFKDQCMYQLSHLVLDTAFVFVVGSSHGK